MQTIYSANQSSYIYSSPVKSDPDTETDESQTFTPKGKENIPNHPDQSHSKLKSSLCKNYAIQGFCPYGKKCQFAHGPQQLRINQTVNTSYKTKPCFSFLKKGYCPYGHRCNFLHHQDKQTSKCIRSKILVNFPEVILFRGRAQSKIIETINNYTL